MESTPLTDTSMPSKATKKDTTAALENVGKLRKKKTDMSCMSSKPRSATENLDSENNSGITDKCAGGSGGNLNLANHYREIDLPKKSESTIGRSSSSATTQFGGFGRNKPSSTTTKQKK